MASSDTQFKKGNPGRPKGTRNKLSESFLSDLNKLWAEHGSKGLEEAWKDDKIAIIKVIAQVLPKEINVSHELLEKVDAMTDDDIREELGRLNRPTEGIPLNHTAH